VIIDKKDFGALVAEMLTSSAAVHNVFFLAMMSRRGPDAIYRRLVAVLFFAIVGDNLSK
jgi:hypothetical protein